MVSLNFTMLAQIVNFLILLFILAKFAYKPLLKAMEDRRNKIIKDLDTAEQTRQDATALKAQYEEQLAAARKEAAGIVDKANKIAQSLHDEMMEEARKERETMLSAAREHIELEKQKALLDIRTEVIELSTQIAGKVLREKLDSAEDQQLVAKAADEVLGNGVQSKQ